MIFADKKDYKIYRQRGAIITLVLVFGTIFVLTFGGLVGFIYSQYRQGKEKVAFTEAMAAAEAGANYARWHLAHAPDDFGFSGLYDYNDPESGVVAQYSLEITSPAGCSTVTTIKSIGWSQDFPDVKRTVQVRYGKPSLAQYSFLTNSDAWFGDTETVKGPLHSNGGIRMDGSQNALFTSAKQTYTCQPEFGCSPAQTKPGIWGAGAGGANGLWEFPVSAVDFNAITVDLAQLKTQAQNGGYYFAPSGAFGYHVVFKDDGSFDLYKVTKLTAAIDGEDTQGIWHHESNDISTGIGSVQLMAEKGTGDNQQKYKSSADNLSGVYASYSWQMNTNPFTGAVWTLAEVNAWTTKFGVQRVSTAEGTPRVTQISGSINYTSNGSPTLYPSAIGHYDQWTVNTGTKTYAVGQTDSDDTTYISASSNNQSETFVLPNVNVPSGATINSVNLYAIARESSGDASIKLRVENGTSGGHQDDSTSYNLTSSYATYSRSMTTNPLTGYAWTVSEVNNWTTRFGVVRSNSSGGTPRVTQIYIVVSYTFNGTVSLAPSSIGNFNNWSVNGTSNKVTAVATNDSDTTYISGVANSQTFGLAGASLASGTTINSVTLTVVAKGIFGNAETFVGNYALGQNQCNAQNLIFLEDKKVWVEGVTKEEVTLAAAQFPDNPDTNSTIIINGNITRLDSAVTIPALIAQKNILVPYNSPNVLEIQAVMVAQKGAVQRYSYSGSIKSQITVRGSIITNNVWTWSWVNGSGQVISGYQNTESFYETALIYDPPPYFPTSGDIQFISWEELR